MKRIFGMILTVILFVSYAAMADGPFNVKMNSTASPQWLEVAGPEDPYPQDPALYFPGADVLATYYDWRGPEGSRYLVRLNDKNATHAYADTAETIFAGTISRPEFEFRVVLIHPAATTEGKIEWFE